MPLESEAQFPCELSVELERAVRTGYVVTCEMYDALYESYYALCSARRMPCLAIVRRGNLSRIDLDMTCNGMTISAEAAAVLMQIAAQFEPCDIHIDHVYFWLMRVPNRTSDILARTILNVITTS